MNLESEFDSTTMIWFANPNRISLLHTSTPFQGSVTLLNFDEDRAVHKWRHGNIRIFLTIPPPITFTCMLFEGLFIKCKMALVGWQLFWVCTKGQYLWNCLISICRKGVKNKGFFVGFIFFVSCTIHNKNIFVINFYVS